MEIGLKVMEGDEAFYYLHQDGELMGGVITHINNFTLTGTEDLIKEVLKTISRELTISKIERDNFRYTGTDILMVKDGIEIEMDDYVNGLKDIKEIRKVERDEDLTKNEIKEYQKQQQK